MKSQICGLMAIAIALYGTDSRAGDLDWPEPVTVNRPGTYWWWMGSAVDQENITRSLEELHKAGVGGVTIIPIYGAKGFEDRYLQHLSPEWLKMMTHTVREGERLGMWVDMTPGTGWPFGGPTVSDDDADAVVVYQDGELFWKFSGRYVKRAAPGGEGKAINPYSSDSLTHYLQRYSQAFREENVLLPRAMYHDSFEFRGNWHADFPAAFQQRRGYDLREHLPALFGEGDPEVCARVKSDYRETLSDLHLQYMQTLQAWAESKRRMVRNQAHGSPSNLLDLYAAADIPETETFGATQFQIPGIRREADNIAKDVPQPLINRMASSAAHVTGKPLVASESCTWVRNHFRTALSQVKPEIDQLFLCGINHVFLHGTCFSPQDAPWPGWVFYASLQYNPRNSIWRDVPTLNAYIARCQSILQSGEPVRDIALYWPVYDIWHEAKGMQQRLTVHHPDWMNKSSCGKIAQWLIENGYSFDFISDRQLLEGQGEQYKAVVVPPTQHLPVATLKHLLADSDRGQTVLFVDHLPDDVPGYHNFEARRQEARHLLQGRDQLVVLSKDLGKRLQSAGIPREPMVDVGLDFVRRTHDEGQHYFIANMSDRPVSDWVKLGTTFQSVVIMDPASASTGVAPARNGNEIYLQLLPGETRILRTFHSKSVNGPPWPILQETGNAPRQITGTWTVQFIEGGPDLPVEYQTTELKSWTDRDELSAQRFAGTARYTIEFDLPENGADEWVIDLGDVRESARVWVNGRQAATLISVPYRARIGEFLKPGRNQLAIEVTNLSANRIRDLDQRGVDWKIFHDINLVDQRYKKFDASNWELTPSGLLGPVTLTPMKKLDL